MNYHNWRTEQEHRRLTDVAESELGKKDRALKIYKQNDYFGWLGVTQGHWQCHHIRLHDF